MIPIAPRGLPILPGLFILVTAGGCGGGSEGTVDPGPVASMPLVESFSPVAEIEADHGEVVSFSVTPRRIPCSFDWSIDGGRVACAGNRLVLDTSALSEGLHAVSVDVVRGAESGKAASVAWNVRIGSKDTARR